MFMLATRMIAECQNHPLSIGIRLPAQWERQKATVEYSFGNKVVTGNAVNFGVDVLAERSGNPWKFYGGLGYFRNQINIQRLFDHSVFNPARDSLPFGSITRHYTYYLLRIPAGVKYLLYRDSQHAIDVGLENNLNWSLKRKYDGPKPPGISRDNTYGQASFFGNTVNLFFTYTIFNEKNNQLSAGPYVRLLNVYKKDFILYENESENYKYYFDALGIQLQYSFLP